MNFQSYNIPSVIERYNVPLINVNSTPENTIQLYDNGSGYLIGSLALKQGQAPYRNINSSPGDLDYQLLAKAGLLLACQGKPADIALTTGFPYTTYELFKQQAIDFYTPRDIFIEFNADTANSNSHKRIPMTIKHIDVIPEILGCINGIKYGPCAEKENFFVVSLGYGTCETGLSTAEGLIGRTCMSVSGLRYAVTNLQTELSRSYNLGMKNEHMINQSFQNGKITVDRRAKDLTDLRQNQLVNYYDEVISPTLKKAFTDNDFEQAQKLYLVGGGAMYTDLAECFRKEFEDILEVIVPDEPSHMASIGYSLKAHQWGSSAFAAVGLDIGNAYTVVSVIPQGTLLPNAEPEQKREIATKEANLPG